jgi:hypothetical protein
MSSPPIKSEAPCYRGDAPNVTTNGEAYGSKPALQFFSDESAGRVVLAGMLNGSNGELPDADLFFIPAHRIIFDAIARLKSRNDPLHVITLTQELSAAGELEKVGGADAVMQIGLETSSPEIVSYELELLRDARARREARAIGQRISAGDIELADATKQLEKIVERSRSAESEFTIRPASEILELKLDEHDCLFGDRLLSKGGKLVIAGAAGIGKSRLLLQFAAACITGRPFCGIETHARGLRWLILQTENSNRRLQQDLEALRREFGESFLESLFIHTVESDIDGNVALDNESAVRRMEAEIRKVRPGIIGADPLRDFGIGDLNTDKDMQDTCSALGRICRSRDSQRAIVAIHHALTGKAGAAKATGYDRSSFARNNKALLGWARAQINVAPGSPDDNDTLVIACGKNNDGKEFPKFAVRLNPDTMIYEPLADFSFDDWRDEISGKSKRYGAKSVVDALGTRILSKKELAKEVIDETGCAKSRAYELIDEAQRQRLIRFNRTLKSYEKP